MIGLYNYRTLSKKKSMVSGKEVHIGDGEKGVAHSYLGVDLSKHSYTLGQICTV